MQIFMLQSKKIHPVLSVTRVDATHSRERIPFGSTKFTARLPRTFLVRVCKMHKSVSPKWLIASVALLASATFATHALAGDCEDDQVDQVGKAIASAASAKLSGIVPGAGKQMINIDDCSAAGGALKATFKYNVIGSDGLYWASGEAKVAGKAVADMKFTALSPNLASASAKSGVKLASN